jgi:hypothetical protein
MLREEIDYQEFCRRGQMRQKNGAKATRLLKEREFAYLIMVRCDRRDDWWATPKR